jgi:hypothetical protein
MCSFPCWEGGQAGRVGQMATIDGGSGRQARPKGGAGGAAAPGPKILGALRGYVSVVVWPISLPSGEEKIGQKLGSWASNRGL